MLSLLGCSTSGHGGRGRDSEEPAKLITTSAQFESGYSTEITKLDGHPQSGSSHTLRPGRHSVEVIGKNDGRDNSRRAKGALFGPLGAAVAYGTEEETRSKPLTACFIARPGHTYEVRTFAEGGVWKVEVFDHETTFDVKSPCKRVP